MAGAAEPQISAQLEHVSAGCNRVRGCLDWSAAGLVAFGSHNAVVLYAHEEAKVVAVLTGHTDRVNAVTWICGLDEHVLLSGDASGSLRAWQVHLETPEHPWHCLWSTKAFEGSVSALTAHQLTNSNILVVAGGGNGALGSWEHAPDFKADAPCVPIATGGIIPCAVAATLLSDSRVLLAVGGADNAVRVYLREADGQCTALCKLQGHTDWVTSVAFTSSDLQILVVTLGHMEIKQTVGQTRRSAEGRLLLASASQDKYIRIWVLREASTARTSSQSAAPAFARYAPQLRFSIGGCPWLGELEALLIGHEDWVNSVAWQPAPSTSSSAQTPLGRLSPPHSTAVHSVPQQADDRPQPVCQGQTLESAAASSSQANVQLPGTSSAPETSAGEHGAVWPGRAQETSSSQMSAEDRAEAGPAPDTSHAQMSPEDADQAAAQSSSNSPQEREGSLCSVGPCLLSASMDRTMLLWRPDAATGLWLSEESVGDAGASSLGYFGGCWGPRGDYLLAHGFTGALHLWQRSALRCSLLCTEHLAVALRQRARLDEPKQKLQYLVCVDATKMSKAGSVRLTDNDEVLFLF